MWDFPAKFTNYPSKLKTLSIPKKKARRFFCELMLIDQDNSYFELTRILDWLLSLSSSNPSSTI